MNNIRYDKITLKNIFQLDLSVKICDKLINMTEVNTLILSQLMNECQRLNNKLCQLSTDLFYKCIFNILSLFIFNINVTKSCLSLAVFAVISISVNIFRNSINLSEINTRCLKTDVECITQWAHCMINELCLYCSSNQY